MTFIRIGGFYTVKKLISKMKVFHLIMLCIAGAIILSALPFKTDYSNIYVNIESTPDVSKVEDATGEDTNGVGEKQKLLFELFEVNTSPKFVDNDGVQFKNSFDEYKVQVFEFEQNLNSLNTMILWYGILTLIGVAVLYIFSNQNRKIYYKSNLIVSALFTTFMVVFGIILLVKSFGLMGDYSSNSNLYNIVSVMQANDEQAINARNAAESGNIDVLYSAFDTSVITFVIYDIIFIAVLAYSIFLFILSFVKYNATKERRNELVKAVAVND